MLRVESKISPIQESQRIHLFPSHLDHVDQSSCFLHVNHRSFSLATHNCPVHLLNPSCTVEQDCFAGKSMRTKSRRQGSAWSHAPCNLDKKINGSIPQSLCTLVQIAIKTWEGMLCALSLLHMVVLYLLLRSLVVVAKGVQPAQ